MGALYFYLGQSFTYTEERDARKRHMKRQMEMISFKVGESRKTQILKREENLESSYKVVRFGLRRPITQALSRTERPRLKI